MTSKQNMIVKSKKTSRLVPEGTHPASLVSVTGKPNDIEPKKIIFGFKVNGHEGELTKEVPVSFEERATLRKDVETLQGRQLTAKEAEEGINLQSLVGRRCQAIVTHKSGVGGKPVAVVTLLQPLAEISQTAAH